jgi:hypothetical protein
LRLQTGEEGTATVAVYTSTPLISQPATTYPLPDVIFNIHIERMALQFQGTSFHLAVERFRTTLSDKEKREFGATTLSDLHVAIEKIQKRQASEKKLQSMRRLERFLEGMKEYDKVISVFLNSSQVLAYVWVCLHVARYHIKRPAMLTLFTGTHEVPTTGCLYFLRGF